MADGWWHGSKREMSSAPPAKVVGRVGLPAVVHSQSENAEDTDEALSFETRESRTRAGMASATAFGVQRLRHGGTDVIHSIHY